MKVELNHYRITGTSNPDSAILPSGSAHTVMEIRRIEALLGKPVERAPEGGIVLSDKDSALMGTAIGAAEAARKVDIKFRADACVALARTVRELHGEAAYQRLLDFLKEASGVVCDPAPSPFDAILAPPAKPSLLAGYASAPVHVTATKGSHVWLATALTPTESEAHIRALNGPLRRRTAEEALDLPMRAVEFLLGRVPEKGPDGKHQLSEREVLILGTATGAADVMLEHGFDRAKLDTIIKTLTNDTVAEFGRDVSKRILAYCRSGLVKLRERVLLGDAAHDEATHAAAVAEFSAWLPSAPELQRPDGSQLHKIKEATRDRAVMQVFKTDKMPPDLADAFDCVEHSFVVEHNWAAAFEGAKDFDGGELQLPFPQCAFEFQVSGKRVVVVMQQDEDGIVVIPLFGLKAGWMSPESYEFAGDKMRALNRGGEPIVQKAQPTVDLIAANVRAVCITLEAEIAETSVMRIDHKLNRAREKRGKLPLLDYHVVSLASRSRVLPRDRSALDPDREYTPKRCHFRRAHYRHFPTYKIRIKWMLVGDPDLGFVDKHYRL